MDISGIGHGEMMRQVQLMSEQRRAAVEAARAAEAAEGEFWDAHYEAADDDEAGSADDTREAGRG